MPRRALRRCTICKKFHASYLVEDPEFGKCYLCLSCWRARPTLLIEQSVQHAKENAGANTVLPKTKLKGSPSLETK